MHLGSAWHDLQRGLLQLLAPAKGVCLTCQGVITRPSGDIPGICGRCAALIPWIQSIRCPDCGRPSGCPDCRREGTALRAFVCNRSAVSYSEDMRAWIGSYKYRGNERLADPLAHMLEKAYLAMRREFTVYRELHRGRDGQGHGIRFGTGMTRNKFWQADLLTSVPVSEERLLERGFNQAAELALRLGQRQRIPCMELLVRSRDTGKQSFKTRRERLESMHSVFKVDERAAEGLLGRVKHGELGQQGLPLRIVLVDDIYTTGSTLTACSRLLREYMEKHEISAEIYGLTWARA
ncbi:ComF family protein [Paenibacillus sp. JX-17]|uniref:ComF family protein n=1 Tax=Paenibacillus lacisoli TaxID=3064525 RepID=A0ABT9CBC3_9BACL|nr:ComF family protein [Paenibacillus sp. JX-17]MDO7906558.1 ComF family protein [Paenibacillus sp. JX-17]